jgi:hypothetical protein
LPFLDGNWPSSSNTYLRMLLTDLGVWPVLWWVGGFSCFWEPIRCVSHWGALSQSLGSTFLSNPHERTSCRFWMNPFPAIAGLPLASSLESSASLWSVSSEVVSESYHTSVISKCRVETIWAVHRWVGQGSLSHLSEQMHGSTLVAVVHWVWRPHISSGGDLSVVPTANMFLTKGASLVKAPPSPTIRPDGGLSSLLP